jgi:hypothetical protein
MLAGAADAEAETAPIAPKTMSELRMARTSKETTLRRCDIFSILSCGSVGSVIFL